MLWTAGRRLTTRSARSHPGRERARPNSERRVQVRGPRVNPRGSERRRPLPGVRGSCAVAVLNSAAAWLLLTAVAAAQPVANVPRLRAIAAQNRRDFPALRAAAQAWAAQYNFPYRVENLNGVTRQVRSAPPAGPLRIIQTYNLNAAISISTNQVWPGGATGLNLTGTGVILGIWDGGQVRTTHQEMTPRATQRDKFVSPYDLNFHATHVAGTMVAQGVNPAAKGMSFQGNLDAFDWDFDTAEMAEAAIEGIRVSNHSYGYRAGWDCCLMGNLIWWGDNRLPPNVADPYFGHYDDVAAEWDDIAFNAPQYLMVKAAGNARLFGPPFQPFAHYEFDYENNFQPFVTNTVRPLNGAPLGHDTLTDSANAKNNLVVGAVNDVPGGYSGPGSVTLAGFSSWGPTDDGRIKPDVSGNGVLLTSSFETSDTAYGTISGTSMASPNVSGSIGLLIQHYRATHGGQDARSASMRGLVIHTADECGANPGPEYSFGWGLMNTRVAAQTITTDVFRPDTITESSLSNGQTFMLPFTVQQGATELRATLCWTDPPAPQTMIGPLFKLINDLDLRIDGPTRQTFLPWVLDPLNPSAAATKGDNVRDNVEQVVIMDPEVGDYTIRVSHKGALNGGSQAFSLIVATDCPALTINSPPADRTVCSGQTATFTVGATGASHYEWRKNGAPIGNDSPTLTLTDVRESDNGAMITCLVSSACEDRETAPARLTVNRFVTTHGIDLVTCNTQGAATLAISADGSNLTYQWYRNGVPITGATLRTLSIAAGIVPLVGTVHAVVEGMECGSATTVTLPIADCNSNGTLDLCEIRSGAISDCDGNLVPDECEDGLATLLASEATVCRGQGPAPIPGVDVVRRGHPPYDYQWRIVSGPSMTGLVAATTTQPVVEFDPPAAGLYELEASVGDSSLIVCRSVKRINVTAVDPISVNAGPDRNVCTGLSAVVGGSPTVQGGATNPQIQWMIVSGGSGLWISDVTAANPLIVARTPGTYRLRVSVTDRAEVLNGCSGMDEVDLHASAVDVPVLNPVSTDVNRPLTLNAPPTPPLVAPGVSLQWRLVRNPGNAGQLTGETTASPVFTATAPGRFEADVSATDGTGCMGGARIVINVAGLPLLTPVPNGDGPPAPNPLINLLPCFNAGLLELSVLTALVGGACLVSGRRRRRAERLTRHRSPP